MTKPEMILFDYGHTLLYQPGFNASNGNRFEFVLASSDYLFRKPDSMMFEIGLQKAKLTADKVWYCGDSLEADVYGAGKAGIFPVLYQGEASEAANSFTSQNKEAMIDHEYLHIHDWRELIDILDRLEG